MRPVEQEGQRGDEEVGLDPLLPPKVDRPQFDHVRELAGGALDLGPFLGGLEGFNRREVRLFGPHDVLALGGLLPRAASRLMRN